MIRVLHYSPHNENDGIAKYQEQYFQGMAKLDNIENEFFDVSPLRFRLLDDVEKSNVLAKLRAEMHEFDILHIQHEFGLFNNDDFKSVFDAAKDSGKKVIVSVHLSPEYAIPKAELGGLSPRSMVDFARKKRHYDRMTAQHITPLLGADKLLVHNDTTARALERAGADKNKIVKLVHPVYEFTQPPKTHVIHDKLSYKNGDVIYCTVGMIHRYKGVFDAVRALKFLPDNYKLAIIGGMNPFSDEVPIYNKICDLIDTLGLHQRVYITGFVVDDTQMNSFIQECDVCVFPYDNSYYGNLSSGSINLAIANERPVIAYPTSGFRELSESSKGAVKLCDTFAYYELARELMRLDTEKQIELSRAYAKYYGWSKMAEKLADIYRSVI